VEGFEFVERGGAGVGGAVVEGGLGEGFEREQVRLNGGDCDHSRSSGAGMFDEERQGGEVAAGGDEGGKEGGLAVVSIP
jgi:hypothetical protein